VARRVGNHPLDVGSRRFLRGSAALSIAPKLRKALDQRVTRPLELREVCHVGDGAGIDRSPAGRTAVVLPGVCRQRSLQPRDLGAELLPGVALRDRCLRLGRGDGSAPHRFRLTLRAGRVEHRAELATAEAELVRFRDRLVERLG
jgi:hypothetical protein